MDDKELDKILEEIRKRSEAQKTESEGTIEKNAPKEEFTFSEPVIEETPVPAFEPDFSFENKNEEAAKEVDEAPTEEPEEEELPDIEDINLLDFASAPIEEEPEEPEETKKGGKKVLIAVIAVVLILAIGAGVYFGFFAKRGVDDKTTSAKPVTELVTADKDLGPINPLTGETGYNESALNKRPVAVVVENEYSTESVRPQWGLKDADIVLEGESEFSTRLLLFWADYTNMPSQIGPTRSARPPFIRFSQLFDSVFIHAGLSKSKGNYTGADTVFENENVDHINLLRYEESGHFFGRDYNRTRTVEHTGYLNGTNTPELLEKVGFNTTLNQAKFSTLNFNKSTEKLSDTAAQSVHFKWSQGYCPKTGKFTYNAETGKYTTSDFDSYFGEADLEFENLIFLLDETDYVVKENYKGSGNSETYCNYRLTGGEGKVLSEGTVVDISWGVDNKKLWMKTSDGKDLVLNPGKSYIGYGSSNHGGSITVNPTE